MKRVSVICICTFLFCSCDILLPRPISYIEEDEYEGQDYVDEQEFFETTSTDLANQSEDETDAVVFLTNFYNQLINGWLRGSPSSAYKEFLSDELLEAFVYFGKYYNETGYIVLDSDPFIKAQDLVGDLREGKFVINRTNDTNVYEMCSGNTRVKLYVAKRNGRYVIYDVENELAGTIGRLYHNMMYSY